jgi:type II secretory pathway component PulF
MNNENNDRGIPTAVAAKPSRLGGLTGIFKRTKKPEVPKPRGSRAATIEGKKPFMLRFSTAQQIAFTKRLGMIMRSGMSIMEGLHMLKDQSSGSAAYIFESITVDVSNGQPLSSGMQKFERFFGVFCVNIIRVAESSGTLYQNLEYISEELKKKQALRRKVIGALIYPAVIVTATLGITLLLTLYIFPKIVPVFASVKATLPFTTRSLIAISGFLSHWGWVLLGVIVILFVIFFLSLRIRKVHLFFDRLLLRLPIFGSISRYYNLTNISRTLSLLLHSDVRIVAAIDLVAASTRNLAYRDSLIASRERLMKGQKISSQFTQQPRLYPSIFAQMITVGESTGNLTSTLKYLSEMYEEEIGELTKNLTTMLEPILMIVMGLIVGYIAISIITPIYSITQNLNPHA